MKATGIVRHIDDLGRVVIPKELRRTYKLHENDPVEIFTSEDGIVLKKYVPTINLEEDAQIWLKKNKSLMNKWNVSFSIRENVTFCQGVCNDKMVMGHAVCSSNDTFSPAIGMVGACCRAFNLPLPESFEEVLL